jgi:lysozyme family protein
MNESTIKAIQGILGVEQDGIWGRKSQAALDAIVHPKPEYSKAFTDIIPWLFEWEGTVFENDPDDPGGATKYGIDQRSHPEVNIRNLTADQATEIYWNDYWLKSGADKLPTPYAEVVFNCAVNMGTGRSNEFDQIAKGDPEKFLELQEAKYRSLAENPRRAKYLNGWINRTESLRKRFNL